VVYFVGSVAYTAGKTKVPQPPGQLLGRDLGSMPEEGAESAKLE
jgi:hypothetical protein